MNSFAAYTLVFTATGGGENKTENRTSANYSSAVTLKAGTYNLTVNAYADGDRFRIAATGTLTGISISAGTSASGSVTLSMISNSGSGTFHYNVNITASGVTSASMEITQGNAPISGSPVTLNTSSVTSGNLNGLASGDYNVRVTLITGGDVKEEAVWNELLHIRAEMTSAFTKTFDNEFFYSTHYNAAFNYNYPGAPTAGTQSVIHGGTLTKPADPTRTGYTFDGWYKESTTQNLWNFTDNVTSTVTLYAKWNINTYTVTFDSNGGSAVGNITNVTHGSTITAPADPTKAYINFDGWYKESTLQNPWNFTTDTVTADTTLYAKWVIFLVTNETELRYVGKGTANPDPYKTWTLTAHYRQTANITLTQGNWTPIGDYFTGSYNGDGHTITGLTINASTDNQGMFRSIGVGEGSTGKVENLGLINVSITSSNGRNVGGIAGGVYGNGTIQNCYVSGSVTGSRYVGGIAGGAYGNGTIQNCYVSGTVTGDISVGGIAGDNLSKTIQNCYVSGTVTGGNSVGGIVGNNGDGGTIQNCYASGSVTNTGNNVGGIAGSNYGTTRNCIALNESVTTGTITNIGRITGYTSGTLQNNYAWSGMTLANSSYTVTPSYNTLNGRDGQNITATQAKTAATWTTAGNWNTGGIGAWDFTNVWQWNANGMPSLKGVGGVQPWPDYLVDPYTVTFNTNGATGTAPTAQTANAGSSITLPSGSGLTKTDYTFGGWNTNAAGTGTNYAAGDSYTPTASVTLYAKWEAANPTNWVAVTQKPSALTNVFNAIAYANNRFVAGDDYGKMAYSTDGENWTEVADSKFGTNGINAIAYGNNRWVAVGSGGKMAYSVDNGVTWTAVSNTQFDYNINGIAFGNNMFVAVGSNNGSPAGGRIAYSTDNGVTWTAVTNSTFGADTINGIAYDNNMFVAVGNNGKMAYSTNGTTWTAVADSTFGTSFIEAIAYGNNKWVAVGSGGKIAYSTNNGVTWNTASNSLYTQNLNGIAYGNGRFVIVGNNGRMAYSSDDGVTWITISTSVAFEAYNNNLNAIAYGNNKWVAVGQGGKIGVCIQ
jgi:uncharacterized repeat protein (TIGR02543 family)